eukprot:1176896-Pyramimonas_sp.AAC.1
MERCARRAPVACRARAYCLCRALAVRRSERVRWASRGAQVGPDGGGGAMAGGGGGTATGARARRVRYYIPSLYDQLVCFACIPSRMFARGCQRTSAAEYACVLVNIYHSLTTSGVSSAPSPLLTFAKYGRNRQPSATPLVLPPLRPPLYVDDEGGAHEAVIWLTGTPHDPKWEEVADAAVRFV